MKTIKNMICCVAVLTATSAAYAQHLDPTVSVTKDYEGKLLEVDKPAMKVDVPDSVTRFNLDFDYSVLDNGFKGSYRFVPYELDMRPKPDSYREKQLWLRAGLGFTLHPTLDLVWSPRMKGNFRMSVYARHDSYYGRYASVDGILDGTVGSLSTNDPVRKAAAWYCDKDTEGKAIAPVGFDQLTKVGTNGRYDWSTGSMSYDVAYFGVATNDKTVFDFKKNYNAGDIRAHVQSVRDDANYLLYDVALGMRFGGEKLNGLDYAASFIDPSFGGKVNEFVFNLGARLGPVIRTDHGVFVDVDLNAMTYGRSLLTHSGNLALTPKYAYKTDRMNLEAGVRVDFFFRPKPEVNAFTGTKLYQAKGQIVYPDVKFDYAILPDWLDIYARIGGGNHPVPYSHYIEQNHNFSLAYNSLNHSILENTNEAASALLGLRGNVRHKFYWDIDGGWLYTRSTPLDAIYNSLPTIWSGDYHCAFASLKAGYKTERIDFEGFVDYKWTSILKDYGNNKTDKDGNLHFVPGVVEPIRLLVGGKFDYNWKNRIYAGARAQIASNRRVTGSDAFIPWYCDLGLSLQYRWKPRISFWGEAGNLLGQSIQHNVGFAEYGPNLTVGICVIL